MVNNNVERTAPVSQGEANKSRFVDLKELEENQVGPYSEVNQPDETSETRIDDHAKIPWVKGKGP
ncbi:uncharacterized protein G2W53_033328 [Senna tora]|uniref:Uncharacterized protein n=1 Tax=Senna tora TaxID=362788 RepID=A0A834SZX8_9FABA|nr:uncharacterized protein G2W53_033328 [Senna tora]